MQLSFTKKMPSHGSAPLSSALAIIKYGINTHNNDTIPIIINYETTDNIKETSMNITRSDYNLFVR